MRLALSALALGAPRSACSRSVCMLSLCMLSLLLTARVRLALAARSGRVSLWARLALSALAMSAFAVECLMNFTNLPTNQPFLSYLIMIIDFCPGLKVKYLVGWLEGWFIIFLLIPPAYPHIRRAFSAPSLQRVGRVLRSLCLLSLCLRPMCVWSLRLRSLWLRL